MKTLHLAIIVITTMISLVAFGTYVIVHPLFGGIAPSPTFKGYIQIDTPGLEKTYKIGQPINFSVLIQGLGLYPCQSPQIAIYNNDQTKPVFYYTTQSVSCPDSSEHYISYFPSQNNTFSTTINETGNYTVKVSIGQDSYQKQFSVTASHITGIYDTGVEKNDKTNPLGVLALIIYHPPGVCLGPCPPNTFYLKINSVTTAYLMGYIICDGDSCAKTSDLSVLLPIKDALRPNFQMIGLPEDLHWKYGDVVKIQLYVSSTNDTGTASLLDLGNSTIVP